MELPWTRWEVLRLSPGDAPLANPKSESCSVLSDSLRPHELYSPWNSRGQNNGLGSFFLLQGIFPTHGSNPGLSHCRRTLNQLSHKGNPRILEWVAYRSSSRSSWPRNQTGIFCIAGEFFTLTLKANWISSSCLKTSPIPKSSKITLYPVIAAFPIAQHTLAIASSFSSQDQSVHSVVSDSLRLHGLQQARFPCPSPTPGTCSNSCPSSQWCHPIISSSVDPFSFCLQYFLASGAFPMSQFFISSGQSIGLSASASVFLMNIQDWFPLGWIGWISLKSKGLSRVFPNTTAQKHQFFGTQLSSQSNSHIHTWPREKP